MRQRHSNFVDGLPSTRGQWRMGETILRAMKGVKLGNNGDRVEGRGLSRCRFFYFFFFFFTVELS